jgi:hypothetical protein
VRLRGLLTVPAPANADSVFWGPAQDNLGSHLNSLSVLTESYFTVEIWQCRFAAQVGEVQVVREVQV